MLGIGGTNSFIWSSDMPIPSDDLTTAPTAFDSALVVTPKDSIVVAMLFAALATDSIASRPLAAFNESEFGF
jgi:hypothetical protein